MLNQTVSKFDIKFKLFYETIYFRTNQLEAS